MHSPQDPVSPDVTELLLCKYVSTYKFGEPPDPPDNSYIYAHHPAKNGCRPCPRRLLVPVHLYGLKLVIHLTVFTEVLPWIQ